MNNRNKNLKKRKPSICGIIRGIRVVRATEENIKGWLSMVKRQI